MANVVIGYRLEPVWSAGNGMATAALATSMISGKMISSSGGGGFFITPEEFRAIRDNEEIKSLIIQESSKPVPKVIQVVVSMAHDAQVEPNEVLDDLKAQGFALNKRGVLGSTFFFVGEIFDTYVEEAKRIEGVEDIQLKEDVSF